MTLLTVDGPALFLNLQYKARESIREKGQRVTRGVTHWVYERGRQKDMVVSVHGGKVVKIARE